MTDSGISPFSPGVVEYFDEIFTPLKQHSPTVAGFLDPQKSPQQLAEGITDVFTKQAALVELIETLRENDAVIPPLFQEAYLHVYSELPNRRFFDKAAEAELKLFNEEKSQGTSIIFMDVDKLKAINSVYGDDIGDEFLKFSAHHIRNTIREHNGIEDNDVTSHFGGDEFAILITDESQKGAQEIFDILRASFSDLHFDAPDGRRIPVNLSMGLVHAEPQEDFSAFMKRAYAELKSDKANREDIRDTLEIGITGGKDIVEPASS